MVNPDVISNDVLEDGTAEKK